MPDLEGPLYTDIKVMWVNLRVTDARIVAKLPDEKRRMRWIACPLLFVPSFLGGLTN